MNWAIVIGERKKRGAPLSKSNHLADSGLVCNKSSALDLPLCGGGGADRGDGAGTAGVGAAAAGAAGFSTTALPLRSSRIRALILILACVT